MPDSGIAVEDFDVTKLYDVVGIGVAAVDDLLYVSEYPPLNVKVPIRSTERHGGGPACTAIATVGTLQGRAAYIARFGDDELSSYIESSLGQRSVDISHIIHDSQSAPYHSFIVVDSSGNRNVFYDASMYKPVLDHQLSESLIQSAELVLIDHVADPSLLDVAQKVKKLHVPILGDIEGCSEAARRLAKITDHLIVPAEFALWASGSNQLVEACAFLATAQRLTTVVTAGPAGCYCCLGGEPGISHIPAFHVDSFDTNGCGDTFHGAFALAIARRFSPMEALIFASAAAAIKAFAGGGTRRGWDALPTLNEISQFLRSHNHCNHQALLQRIDSMKS